MFVLNKTFKILNHFTFLIAFQKTILLGNLLFN